MKEFKHKHSITYTDIRHIWTALSVICVIAALSFYYADGYYNLGEEKYRIYLRVGGIGALGWGVLILIHMIRSYSVSDLRAALKRFDAVRLFIALFIVSGFIATLTSSFRYTSLWGEDGWHTGFIVQILMIGGCLMCMDFFAGADRRLIYCVILSGAVMSSAVFILGVINRFSIFPFYMYGQAEDFISTLGNINWFCGYWCIWTGIGCGAFLLSDRGLFRLLSGVYVWICSVTGICCGADACYLVWAAVSFAALYWALDTSAHLVRLCDMEMIFLAGLPTVRFIGALRPYRMWYDSAWLKEVSYGNGWMLPYIAGTLFFALLSEIYRIRDIDRSSLRSILVGASTGIIAAVFIIIVLNTYIEGGIWPVRGKSIFTWGVHWGNSRGGIWMVSIALIKRLFPFKIFFGVGCDCMCKYAYSMDDISVTLSRYIGNQYLTNAHNELLSMIINQGIAGAVAYFGFQVSHMYSVYKAIHILKPSVSEADKAKAVYVYRGIMLGTVFATAGYMAIGTVGFMQILSTPFLFMAAGMAQGLIKRANIDIIGRSITEENTER